MNNKYQRTDKLNATVVAKLNETPIDATAHPTDFVLHVRVFLSQPDG